MTPSPHIVVDARLAWGSGIGTYIRNVVPAIARHAPDWRFSLITARTDRDMKWAALPNIRTIPATSGIYGIAEQFELPARTPRDANLFWAPHYNFPLLLKKRLVVTVHDLAHLRLPEFTSRLTRRAYARLMFGMTRTRAMGILFDSLFTRSEFNTLVGASNGVSAVVHLGVAPEWFELTGDETREPAPRQPYFVYVGNIKAHKNLHTLLTAFEAVRRSLDSRLVVVGKSEGLRSFDASVAEKANRMEGVVLAGEVSDGELRHLVRHAAALVQPSVYEGFGLPPLEAMAAGCPAIVARAGSLPEVCGEAAWYFDPTSADHLATVILEVATDPEARKRRADLGREHARGFDWNVTAMKTRALLSQVLA